MLPFDRLNAFWHSLHVADVLPGSKYSQIKLFLSAILTHAIWSTYSMYVTKRLSTRVFYRLGLLKFPGLGEIG